MQLNKTLFTLGNIVEITEIPELMKNDACGWLYFVYKTKNGKQPLSIGTLQHLRREPRDTVVLGVADSKKLARKLALHIVVRALSLDRDLENGLTKLIN